MTQAEKFIAACTQALAATGIESAVIAVRDPVTGEAKAVSTPKTASRPSGYEDLAEIIAQKLQEVGAMDDGSWSGWPG